MCGSLQLSASERLYLIADKLLPTRIFYPAPTREVPLSNHRFIRREKLDWWKKKTPLSKVLIYCKGFYEKEAYFEIPDRFALVCAIHQSIDLGTWVVSLLTTNPALPTREDSLNELGRKVVRVHNRMPFFERVA